MRNLLLSALFMLTLSSAFAQNPVIMGTENHGSHFKIVILAEGYTSSEMSKFDLDAQAAKDAILGLAPFTSNSTKINFYKVSNVSANSGQSVYGGTTVDTYWDVFSNNLNIPRLLGFSQAKRDLVESTYGDMSCGNKVFVIIICNKDYYAGQAGLPSYPTWSTYNTSTCIVNADSSYLGFLVKHEFAGHAFGDLDDEYVDSAYANSGDPFLLHSNRLNVKNTDPGGWLAGARYVTTKWRYGNDLMRSSTYSFHSRNEGLVQDRIDDEVSVGTSFLMERSGTTSISCSSGARRLTKYHNGCETLPEVGDYIFTSSAMTTAVNGGDKWWRLSVTDSGFTIKVDASGKVLQVAECYQGYPL